MDNKTPAPNSVEQSAQQVFKAIQNQPAAAPAAQTAQPRQAPAEQQQQPPVVPVPPVAPATAQPAAPYAGDTTLQPTQAATPDTAADKNDGDKPNVRKEHTKFWLLRLIIGILIIVVGVWLVLWIIARASLYSSIGDMLQHMFQHMDIMWKRVLQ